MFDNLAMLAAILRSKTARNVCKSPKTTFCKTLKQIFFLLIQNKIPSTYLKRNFIYHSKKNKFQNLENFRKAIFTLARLETFSERYQDYFDTYWSGSNKVKRQSCAA